jgi:dolichyl-diphosphooligosaccharide--protein glycosyltransferase
MFFFMAIKESEGKRLGEMVRDGWQGIWKPVIYGLLSGVFFGLYMLTWEGALLFAMILFIFIVIQAVIEHLKGRPLDYLGIMVAGLFGVGLAMYLPWAKSSLTIMSLVIGLLGSVLLVAISRYMARRRIKPLAYPLSLAGLAIVGTVSLAIISPAILQSMLGSIAIIFVWPVGTTNMEMQPLLIQQENFTFAVATGNYMLSFFFSLVCMAVLFYQVIKGGRPDKALLLVWSVIILMSALSMRRFAYYFAVNVALLTGYLCWIPLSLLLPKKQIAATVPINKNTTAKSRRRAAQEQSRPKIQRNTGLITLLLAAIVLLVYYPNIGPLPDGQKPAIDLATRPLFAPSDAWCETMDWLRTNTPEPFEKPETYYGLYQPVNEKGGFEYPASAYGVLAWWDYGYWIARIGQRPPNTNPGTGHLGTAYFFTAQDELTAAGAINQLGTRYVIADNEIAAYDGKFHALATLSGSNYSRFYDVFLQKQDNQYMPTIRFYPEYYRTMISRLYNFDGKAVVPDDVNVIAYKEITAQDGRVYKEITETKTISSYSEAQKFILDNKSKNCIIAGQDPYQSCVPLEELKNYRLVYSSSEKISSGSKSQPVIKIFEHGKDIVPITVDQIR